MSVLSIMQTAAKSVAVFIVLVIAFAIENPFAPLLCCQRFASQVSTAYVGQTRNNFLWKLTVFAVPKMTLDSSLHTSRSSD